MNEKPDKPKKMYFCTMKKKLIHLSFMRTLTVMLSLITLTSGFCTAQVCGCTDSLATNYDPDATVNDGSCLYPATIISSVVIGELDTVLNSTSSLFYWENGYWTYNDWDDSCLYMIDSTTGAIQNTICIDGVVCQEAEETAQDSLYLYLGMMGNNNGDRHDLHILRINKESLLNQTFEIDTIGFSYEDQTDFSYHYYSNDFDCEAFIVSDDSIYLFTKQWVSKQTTVYRIPKVPGTHIARRHESYNVNGLITGASFLPDYQLVVLCGYNYDSGDYEASLRPFIYLLYDYQENNFFSGNKRRLDFGITVKSQIEAIATTNAVDYYLTNENFHRTFMGGLLTVNLPAQLQRLDLREFLVPYLSQYIDSFPPPPAPDTLSQPDTIPPSDGIHDLQSRTDNFHIYPNPAKDRIHIDYPQEFQGAEYAIFSLNGQKVSDGVLQGNTILLNARNIPAGKYLLIVRKNGSSKTFSFIKKE